MNWKFIRSVLIKTAVFLVVIVTVLGLVNFVPAISRVSIYNHWVPGRVRLPYGATPSKSYNLTISDLDTMLASHVISAGKKPADEFRVILLGDSSIWGFLLKPNETLAGQLNAMDLHTPEGKRIVFYNLGYPTLSVIKDYLILEKVLTYQPDLIIWSVTLESLSEKNALHSPMTTEADLQRLSGELGFSFTATNQKSSIVSTFSDTRRMLSDWYRLQLYGFMWAATGIDQDYPPLSTPAQRDLAADPTFEGCQVGDFKCVQALYGVLEAGIQNSAKVPVWIVNEPMLISSGMNSDLRYNFYYPRWAYDQYRSEMVVMAQESGWKYLDLWNLVPENEFTNSAIHMTPAGEALLVQRIASELTK
jgi:hypothetical protein